MVNQFSSANCIVNSVGNKSLRAGRFENVFVYPSSVRVFALNIAKSIRRIPVGYDALPYYWNTLKFDFIFDCRANLHFYWNIAEYFGVQLGGSQCFQVFSRCKKIKYLLLSFRYKKDWLMMCSGMFIEPLKHPLNSDGRIYIHSPVILRGLRFY